MFGVFGQYTNLECLCVSESASKKCWAPPLTHLSHIFQCATFWRSAANHEHSIFVVIRSHLFTNIGAVLFNIRWHFVRLSICPAIHSPFDGDAPIFESLFLSRQISVVFFLFSVHLKLCRCQSSYTNTHAVSIVQLEMEG